MHRLSLSHRVFAAAFVGLGLAGLWRGDFEGVWGGVPAGLPAARLLVYLCAGVALVGGLGLLWPRTASAAARLLLGYLLFWLVVFKGRFILQAPLQEVSYQTCGETAVMAAGAWVLYAGTASAWERRRIGFAVGDKGVAVARVLFGLALIAFGLSHFFYVQMTAPLVPKWLPAPTAWAYFTGGAYLAAGLAVLSGILARLAASLSAVQMGLFGLLIWAPLAVTGQLKPFQWGEFVVTCLLTASAWVVADSYRGTPWLGRSDRSLSGPSQ